MVQNLSSVTSPLKQKNTISNKYIYSGKYQYCDNVLYGKQVHVVNSYYLN